VSEVRLDPSGFLARPELRRLFGVLDRDGERAMAVGGAVRNALMGQDPLDVDIATTALPGEVMRRAGAAGLKAVPTGIEHGTVTIIVEHHPYEVTTLREDVETDGRRAKVVFGRDFSHDARRRDFTINALYADAEGRVHDFVGGVADIEARRVRFIGDPGQRIREDYLRILRLFRFHAAYGEGEVDRDSLEAAIRARLGLERLSRERIRIEILKTIPARRSPEALAAMAEAGILDLILAGVPDLAGFAGIGRARSDPMLGLAALALRVEEDAGRLTERLRLSNAERDRLSAIARGLEALHGDRPSPSSGHVRRLAWAVGSDAVADALVVLSARNQEHAGSILALADEARQPLPASPWSGADLLKRGLQPGPRVGEVLARAQALWIEADFPPDPAEQERILARVLADDVSGKTRSH
jgi:tRNA nucleotidyltransferase/poly(A) polymerase